jgi:outer membrane beta-barrel protein
MRAMIKGLSFAIAFALGAGVYSPAPVHAQERKSPLADAPAVRRRVELREQRFEIGVGAGTTLGQDFYNAVMVNARLGLHLTDWLAIGAVGFFNLTPKYQTAFADKLLGVLKDTTTDRTPTKGEALAGMNHIGEVVAAQAEIIPFTGKFSLFNKLFMDYDFYVFGGVGAVDLKADTVCDTPRENVSCAVTGFKIGPNFGGGIHMFATNWFALNFEVRDILIRDNPAGRDENGDRVANGDDLSWTSNILLSLNLSFFLPAHPPVSP